MEEVGEDWLRAKLTQQRGNLAAMIRAVICQVLQRLPHRIFVNAKIKGAVFHHTIQIVLPVGTLHFVYKEDPYDGEILEFQTPTFTNDRPPPNAATEAAKASR